MNLEGLIEIYNNAPEDPYVNPNSHHAEDRHKRAKLYHLVDKVFGPDNGIIFSSMKKNPDILKKYDSKCLCGHKQIGLVYNIAHKAEDIINHIFNNIDNLKQIIEQNDAWHRGESNE